MGRWPSPSRTLARVALIRSDGSKGACSAYSLKGVFGAPAPQCEAAGASAPVARLMVT